jgi:transposase-like protein
MPRRCTVCDHPERHCIDEALVTGAPYRSVARRFGLSESSVYRHKTEHLPAHLLKAKEVDEVAQADDLLGAALKPRGVPQSGPHIDSGT